MSASLIDALLDEGQSVGRYALERRLAEGGMASVYLARLRSSGGFEKPFAVKLVHPHLARNEKFVKMFIREARLASRLQHPNVCSVVDFGEAHGSYYLVMEYLHGETLAQAIVRTRAQTSGAGLPSGVAARIAADAARGLHAAHELRDASGRAIEVVHRDVSPQNVFVLFDGVTKVVDFGIARSVDGLEEHTATGELRGKAAYMSPEQVAQEGLDRGTDIWALGVVLWEATTGSRLFRRDTDFATTLAVREGKIPLPSTVCRDYPAPLERVVMRALERDRAKRYATAAAMADDLEEFLARSVTALGTAQVAQFMRATFGDRAVPSAATPGPASPPGEIVEETFTETPTGARAHPTPAMRPAEIPSAIARPPTPPAKAPGRNRFVVASTLVALALLGSGAFAFRAASRPGRTGPGVSIAPRQRPSGAPTGVVSAPETARTAVASEHDAAVSPSPSLALSSPVTATSHAAPVARPPVVTAGSTHASRPIAALSTRATVPAPATPTTVAIMQPTLAISAVAAAPAGSMGRVNVLAMPFSVRVYEGNTRLGETPLVNIPMESGRHVFRLVPRDGQPERTVTIDVRPNRVTPVVARWEQ